ncbi:hypothetical protein K501DRAFT_276547 [Backusella circina FSU 941]|nr:hypothetical protein K501DRAFT_276547 [Backusella circina FSU 941]
MVALTCNGAMLAEVTWEAVLLKTMPESVPEDDKVSLPLFISPRKCQLFQFVTRLLFCSEKAICCILRSVPSQLSPSSCTLAMIGQIIGSCTATWFTDDKGATTGVFEAFNYSAIIGMFMVPKLVTRLEKLPGSVHIVSRIACAIFIPPYSITTSEDSPSFSRGICLLAKTYNYWLLFMVHRLNIELGPIFTQIISPYGCTYIQADQMNAIVSLREHWADINSSKIRMTCIMHYI